MTAYELREHPEYKQAMQKITSYRKGFEFTINWARIPRPQANALKIIMRDAIDAGLLEPIATGFNLDLDETEATYRRL